MIPPTVAFARIPPLAVDAAGAAELSGVSVSLWHKLKASGRVPRPVRLGRRVVWLVEELRAWLAAGAPSCERWEAMKAASRGAAK